MPALGWHAPIRRRSVFELNGGPGAQRSKETDTDPVTPPNKRLVRTLSFGEWNSCYIAAVFNAKTRHRTMAVQLAVHRLGRLVAQASQNRNARFRSRCGVAPSDHFRIAVGPLKSRPVANGQVILRLCQGARNLRS
jgi:hypothetical protein